MNYYETLNINPSATKSEIKQAYRQLAKKYHPDISKDPDAHNKFIEISEAYESLMGYSNVYDQTTTYAWDDFYNEEDLRRQRAREYAQMKYEEFVRNNEAFKKSWYYWPAMMFNNFLNGVLYILALFCFATAVYLFINFNIRNLIGGFMFVAGGMFLVKTIRDTKRKD